MTNKFFSFGQNNAGGRFVENDQVGHFVFIEAPDAETANDVASECGIDFQSGCDCCGPRWRMAGEDEGIEGLFDEDGQRLEKGAPFHHTFNRKAITAHVYFTNGTHVILNVKDTRIQEVHVHC